MWRARFSLLLLLTVLADCSHIPVTSLIKLASIDFKSTNLAELRVAVKLPQQLQPLPHGMVLRIAVKAGDAAEETRDFALQEIAQPPQLAPEATADTHLFAYRLGDAEVPRLAAFRAEMLARKSEGRGGNLSIKVTPNGCRTAELPDGPIYFTTYLRTAETVDYIMLARDVDLRSVTPGRDITADIPRCS